MAFHFPTETFYNHGIELVTFEGALDNPTGLENGGSAMPNGNDSFFLSMIERSVKDMTNWIKPYSFGGNSRRSLNHI